MSFYNVMLRGQVSRILLSDPAYKPLAEPLTPPSTKSTAAHDSKAGVCVVTVELLRHESGPFINYLPKPPKDRFDNRLYARVAIPETVSGRLESLNVTVTSGQTPVELIRSHVKHEVWGGRRFVNVQVESASGRLVTPGARAVFEFAVTR